VKWLNLALNAISIIQEIVIIMVVVMINAYAMDASFISR